MPKRPPTHFIDTFSQLRRRLTGVVDEAHAPLGIGTTQAKLLREIGAGGVVSQADLARRTATDPALTGRALRTLLDRGLVQRRRSKEDARAFSLVLTAAGQALLVDVLAAREALAARFDACLTERDLVAFERIAAKLLSIVAAGDERLDSK